MRCYICDNLLAPEEIRFDGEVFEPCRTCVDASFDPLEDPEDDDFLILDDEFPGC